MLPEQQLATDAKHLCPLPLDETDQGPWAALRWDANVLVGWAEGQLVAAGEAIDILPAVTAGDSPFFRGHYVPPDQDGFLLQGQTPARWTYS